MLGSLHAHAVLRFPHRAGLVPRHLAEKWATTYIPPHPRRRLTVSATQLSTIEHLVLLDLLGAPAPQIRSFFLSTAWLFDALASAERRLGQAGLFHDVWDNRQSFFIPRTGQEHNGGYISDDHVPFLQRGVSILHVIASPFPRVWHTLKVPNTPSTGLWILTSLPRTMRLH